MIWINFVILFCIVAIVLGIALIRDMLVAVVLLSIFSFLMALIYLIMGAPDVAITEASVGAGMSTILMLAVLCLVGREERPAPAIHLPALLVVLIFGGILMASFMSLPDYGSATSPSYTYVAPHYLRVSQVEIGIPNPVTAVLASYRGYDTLGEATVVFTAGVSVMLLLGTWKRKRKHHE